MDWKENSKSRIGQIQELEKFHYQAYGSYVLDKEQIKRWNDVGY